MIMGSLGKRLTGVLLAGAVLAAPAAERAEAATLAPHRAVYTMSLVSAEASSDIATARGVFSIDLEQSCGGWTFNQAMQLERQHVTGEAIDFVLEFSSFESFDGLSYQFTSRTLTQDTVIDEYRGAAERDAVDDPGEALYVVPEGRRVALPAGTVFPMQHTLLVLEAAERGERVVFRKFFDGLRPDESPFDANVIILDGPMPAAEGPATGLEETNAALMAYEWWPLRVAFFPGVGQESVPDFELESKTQTNGVAREYVFDYGDFVMRADLARIEPGEQMDCP